MKDSTIINSNYNSNSIPQDLGRNSTSLPSFKEELPKNKKLQTW